MMMYQTCFTFGRATAVEVTLVEAVADGVSEEAAKINDVARRAETITRELLLEARVKDLREFINFVMEEPNSLIVLFE
jgi:hypothetical protein